MDQILTLGPYVATVLNVALALVATGHTVLSKRDTRAAIGWVGVIWLAPILGVLLYVWLGINRIERRARSLRTERPRLGLSSDLGDCCPKVPDQADTLAGTPLEPLVKLVRDVTRRPLLAGNRVAPLVNGDQAYPAMLQAIDEAARSITLTTYIFEHDPTGQHFLEALRGAVSRHVEVRVLIDNVGALWLAADTATAATGGNSLRPVPAHDDPVAVSVLEPQEPPQNSGSGRCDRIHGRHQYPCGQLPGASTATSRPGPALSPHRTRGGPTPVRVRRRLGLLHR